MTYVIGFLLVVSKLQTPSQRLTTNGVTVTRLRDDDGEDEAPEDLGEVNASCLVHRLVHEEHLMLVGQMAREEVRYAHHQDERVDDGVRQTNLFFCSRARVAAAFRWIWRQRMSGRTGADGEREDGGRRGAVG